MSEYHSFSLAQHLPSSRSSLKRDAIQQQQRQRQQQQQDQYAFHQHTFNIQHNDDILNCDTRHSVLNLNDTSDSMALVAADHRPNDNENGWTEHQHQQPFQSLDAILNNAPNYNHIRHNTTPVNSNDFLPIFDFLPFDNSSSHGLVMPSSDNHHVNGNNGDAITTSTPSIDGTLHTASNYNVPIAFL
jgi:hypothetical protein